MSAREHLLAFTVHALPVAQGSKVAGRTKSGKAYVRESNAHALHAWRQAVQAEALAEAAGGKGDTVDLPLALGPVALHATFTLPRPKSHYGTGRNARSLKPAAPWYVPTKPDVDKLVRAVCDALTGVAWRDDSQVASLRVAKVYGPRASLTVEVVALPHAEAPS